MFSDPTKLLIVLGCLFLVCTGYAIFLDRHPGLYLPRNRTWVAVVVGNAFIGLAQAALLWWSVAIEPGHIVLTNCVAGAPIIVWQLIRGSSNGAEERAARQQ